MRVADVAGLDVMHANAAQRICAAGVLVEARHAVDNPEVLEVAQRAVGAANDEVNVAIAVQVGTRGRREAVAHPQVRAWP